MTGRRIEPATEAAFDERSYIVANPDIADHVAAGGEARAHFLTHGLAEGRGQRAADPLRNILFLQTADSFKYPRMLAATSTTVIEYCRRAGYHYQMEIGVKRGFWNWQAIYNRIPLMKEKLDQGFDGWLVYMDADAYIVDLDFDLESYLAAHAARAGIFVAALDDAEPWNVNDGVFLVNYAHPEGRRLVSLWHDAFMALSDDWLRATHIWSDGHNDQDLIQAILRTDPAIADAVLIDASDTINSTSARFIRQSLRAQFDDFPSRVRWLEEATARVIGESGRPAPWGLR